MVSFPIRPRLRGISPDAGGNSSATGPIRSRQTTRLLGAPLRHHSLEIAEVLVHLLEREADREEALGGVAGQRARQDLRLAPRRPLRHRLRASARRPRSAAVPGERAATRCRRAGRSRRSGRCRRAAARGAPASPRAAACWRRVRRSRGRGASGARCGAAGRYRLPMTAVPGARARPRAPIVSRSARPWPMPSCRRCSASSSSPRRRPAITPRARAPSGRGCGPPAWRIWRCALDGNTTNDTSKPTTAPTRPRAHDRSPNRARWCGSCPAAAAR